MTESVGWSLDEAVATITLNRPQARNALTAEMKDSLLAAVGKAAADPAVRAVIITGAGEAFCSGQDLREHAEVLASGAEPTATVRQHYNPIITTVMTMPKPVIAAVNGSAAGAGASLALACDFRVAARRASLLMAFARVGLAADSGASVILPRLAGAAKATELLMLAEPVDAERALAASSGCQPIWWTSPSRWSACLPRWTAAPTRGTRAWTACAELPGPACSWAGDQLPWNLGRSLRVKASVAAR